METLFIPNESDFKRWVKEAVQECFQSFIKDQHSDDESADDFIDRKEAAKLLKVSLVTLTDWMKRGLPFHKQRGRVYFIKSEVVQYIKDSHHKKSKFLSGLLQ